MGLEQLTALAIAGDETKDFLVPEGAQYRVLYGMSKLTTDATAANRWMRLGIIDPGAKTIICLCAGASVPASQSDQWCSYLQGVYRETSFINGVLQVPIANNLVVPAGYTIRVFVGNGVAGDSFDCDLMIHNEKGHLFSKGQYG